MEADGKNDGPEYPVNEHSPPYAHHAYLPYLDKQIGKADSKCPHGEYGYHHGKP